MQSITTKELKIMCQNAIYNHISSYRMTKVANFRWKNQQNPRGVSRDLYFLDFFQVRYNYAKFHYCRIYVTDFRNGVFLANQFVSSLEKAILNRVNNVPKKMLKYFVKGTLMQIWKSPNMFAFILK